MTILIWVSHPDDTKLIDDICPTMDLDRGPLMMSPNKTISDYDEWLEDQIKAQNDLVCLVLENIFEKAQTTGIILTTHMTGETNHAHIVKRHIEDIANG